MKMYNLSVALVGARAARREVPTLNRPSTLVLLQYSNRPVTLAAAAAAASSRSKGVRGRASCKQHGLAQCPTIVPIKNCTYIL